VKRKLLLDTGVLSEICHGKVVRPVRGWFERISQRHDVLLSVVADYEVRRELVRSKAARGLTLLDGIPVRAQRLPMTDATWLRAAALWAQLVSTGRTPAKGIAGDVLLAA
jgi:predicted nucleic acid-binding protein